MRCAGNMIFPFSGYTRLSRRSGRRHCGTVSGICLGDVGACCNTPVCFWVTQSVLLGIPTLERGNDEMLEFNMKKKLLLFFVFWSFSVQADNVGWKERCGVLAKIAAAIMDNRQSGVPMDEMMKTVGDSEVDMAILIAAFEKPRYKTEEYKNNAIVNFRNSIYLECVKQLKK